MRRRTILATPALVLPAAARAQAAERWDLPTGFIDSNFHTVTLRLFAEEVKSRSGGRIDIRLHTNNTLVAFATIRRAVQQGQVQIGETLLSLHANEDVVAEADAIPFLAVGYDQAARLYAAQKPHLERRFAQIGLRMLYSVPWPGQGLYTKVTVATPADLRGMRIRTPTTASSRLAELLGAVPTQIQSGEVPQAFATNVVTGMLTSAPTGVDTRAWDFARYFYTADSWHPKNAVLVSERVWRRLDPSLQQALTEAAAVAEPRGWQASREADAEAKRRLAAEGMTVEPPPATVLEAMRAAGRQIAADWARRAGEAGQEIVRAMSA